MTQEIIGASEYTALGTLQRMPYGNGLAQSHALDASGRLEAKAVRNQQATALSRTSYRYNGDNEILSISDDVTANLSQTLGYDGLGRLSTLARSGVTYTLSHDAGGNYTALDATTEATRYAIDAKSNRMLSFSNQDGTRTYQYDALGNRISETSGSRISTFTYGPFNRMVQSNVGGLRTDYLLNAQGSAWARVAQAQPAAISMLDRTSCCPSRPEQPGRTICGSGASWSVSIAMARSVSCTTTTLVGLSMRPTKRSRLCGRPTTMRTGAAF